MARGAEEQVALAPVDHKALVPSEAEVPPSSHPSGLQCKNFVGGECSLALRSSSALKK